MKKLIFKMKLNKSNHANIAVHNGMKQSKQQYNALKRFEK